MYHIFFIHLSVNGHLGCFHDLAIVNSAAVQDCQPVSFGFWSSQGLGPAVGLLDDMVVQFLPFKRSSFLFSLLAVDRKSVV